MHVTVSAVVPLEAILGGNKFILVDMPLLENVNNGTSLAFFAAASPSLIGRVFLLENVNNGTINFDRLHFKST